MVSSRFVSSPSRNLIFCEIRASSAPHLLLVNQSWEDPQMKVLFLRRRAPGVCIGVSERCESCPALETRCCCCICNCICCCCCCCRIAWQSKHLQGCENTPWTACTRDALLQFPHVLQSPISFVYILLITIKIGFLAWLSHLANATATMAATTSTLLYIGEDDMLVRLLQTMMMMMILLQVRLLVLLLCLVHVLLQCVAS